MRCQCVFLLISMLVVTACQQKSHTAGLLFYLDPHGRKTPVASEHDWKKRRSQILKQMEEAMGELPQRTGLPPFDLRVTDSLVERTFKRLTVIFTVAPGEDVSAYLYVPLHDQAEKKSAAMLALHGTGEGGKQLVDGKSIKANRALARELAERGYVVIAPDYPSMGDQKDYDFETDRYTSGTMKAIFNHVRCIDLLQSMSEVDPARIGAIGHSLGGHNAMFAGAFDERLKVVVASCGWTLMDAYDIGEEAAKRYGGRLGPWAQDRYMPLLREKFKLNPDSIPFDFDEVIAAIAPRAFFSNSPVNDSNFDVDGVRRGIAAASQAYQFLGSPGNLQVRYPDAGHDFPPSVRMEAYQFIDSVLQHTPTPHQIQ